MMSGAATCGPRDARMAASDTSTVGRSVELLAELRRVDSAAVFGKVILAVEQHLQQLAADTGWPMLQLAFALEYHDEDEFLANVDTAAALDLLRVYQARESLQHLLSHAAQVEQAPRQAA